MMKYILIFILNLLLPFSVVGQNTQTTPAPIRIVSNVTVDGREIDLLHRTLASCGAAECMDQLSRQG